MNTAFVVETADNGFYYLQNLVNNHLISIKNL